MPTLQMIDPTRLKNLAASIATAAGVPAPDAHILSESLIAADLTGTSTHGISRLGIYVRRIQKGLIDPNAEIQIERERPSTLVVNAGNGLGQVQAWKVLDRLIPMARRAGTASTTIHNSQHFGALSWYCNRAADENQILLAMTNCEPSMSPEGGCQAFFGTNPIAASFPTGKGFHVKIDLATSLVARGNIIAAQKKGETIPQGWALDPDGNPTTDASKALAGTVLTMAGHKGYALAMMVESLSSILSGAAIGASIGSMYKNMDRKQDVGHFFCLLDIDAFMDVADFKQRMDATIDAIKACRKRPGVNEILIPGERSHRTTQRNLREGLRIDPGTLAELKQLCAEFKIDYTLESQ